MARIPEEELERLKQIPIQALAEARGVRFQRRGSDMVALCPFHSEQTPSFVVSPEKNLWNCLGACGRGGSVVDFVMLAEAVSFRQAVELLRAGEGSAAAAAAAGEIRPIKRTTVRKLPPAVELSADEQELFEQVMDYYHRRLLEDADALAYLEKRGIGSRELIEHFRLGVCDRSLGYGLPAKNRKAGGEVRSRLQKIGILRESGHELFWGSIVVGIRDEQGRLVSAYGRKIRDGLRPGTAYHLNLDGKMRGVFNVEALAEYKEIVLCEAIFDALTLWAAGFKNVIATRGAGGFTDEYMEAFIRHGIRRVILGFDRDEAGEREAASLAARLIAAGMEVYRLVLPPGMDVNEYALSATPARRSLGALLRRAEWMGRGPAPSQDAYELEAEAEAQQERSEPEALQSPPALPPPEAAELRAAAPPPEAAEPRATAPPPPESGQRALSSAARAADAEPPAASPVPEGLVEDVEAEVTDEQIVIRIEERRYRVRGLKDNTSHSALRVNLLVSRGDAFHADSLDLYLARARSTFVKQAAAALSLREELLVRDLGRVLMKLEQLQDELIKRALEPRVEAYAMDGAEREAALGLLRDGQLVERILSDFERLGVIGEQTNKLVGYLACVSRKLDRPLGIIIQSSSAAGKSSLMEAIVSLMPEEEVVKFSAMTGQSLYYMDGASLRHKILAISEGEGAERASYALKLLQSEGELSIASPGKDPLTGKLVTHQYRVEGPVMPLWTTTATEMDEELMNRCIVLAVDEGREQTRSIHERQRYEETLEGLLEQEDRSELRSLHQNAQRLLRPLRVVNPDARRLTFLDDRTRLRRDHLKYLRLIRAIALLHQYQRPVRVLEHRGKRVEYIEVEHSDIALANRLASEVLGRSLDELRPQVRRLLMVLEQMVREACERHGCERGEYRFRMRDVREYSGWGNTQLKVHMKKLEELEYVLVHRSGRGQSFVYELVYDGGGKDGSPHLCGLIDPEKLAQEREPAQQYDEERSAPEAERSAPEAERLAPEAARSASGRAEAGPVPAGGRKRSKADDSGSGEAKRAKRARKRKSGATGEEKPYAQPAGRNGSSGAAEEAR
jgi:DNA primase